MTDVVVPPQRAASADWTTAATLTGALVALEPLAAEHADDLLDAGADPLVWRWLPWSQPADAAAMRDLIELVNAQATVWAQIDRRSGRAIGMTSYLDVVPRDRRLEIGGTWIGRAAWRSGINQEAKLLLLRRAFDELGAYRVSLKTDARNDRSQAAIAGIGATREGTLRSHMVRPDGTSRDTVYFSILAPEWPAARALLEQRMHSPR